VDPEVLRREARLLGEREQAAIADADRSEGISEKDRITLGLIALAGRERDLIIAARRMGRVPPGLHQRLLGECDRLLELTRSGGRAGYRRGYRSVLSGSRWLRITWALHERFWISGPLERALERRFEVLIAQCGFLEELPPFIDTRIRRIHGRRVTALLHALVERRRTDTRDALEALRVQLPGYAEETEARWVRRTALEVEEREYRSLHADRLLDQELHDRLVADLARRRAGLDRAPRLDLRARKAELLRGMPALSGLPDTEIRRLASSLHLRRMVPGDLLHRRDDPPGRIHLIGSGAVSVLARSGPYKLGPGEMFGHISVLTRSPRRIEVRALTHGTLFQLDEGALRRLMGRCPKLRSRVEARVLSLRTGDQANEHDDPGN
jgi:CPA1 family monovalent cation:H+ antiporter